MSRKINKVGVSVGDFKEFQIPGFTSAGNLFKGNIGSYFIEIQKPVSNSSIVINIYKGSKALPDIQLSRAIDLNKIDSQDDFENLLRSYVSELNRFLTKLENL